MPPLASELRSFVERKTIEARREAERAARAALTALAVENPQAGSALSDDQRRLRNALRARARQLGEGQLAAGMQPLMDEVAYEQWHRMLFARFLAENELLYHPEHQVPVDLEFCAELADERGDGDPWSVAAEFASAMLPGIFRADDPSVKVRLAPEGLQALERILEELPPPLFQADDGLGWMYQFWQSQKKKEVNESGRKVSGADLAPVTQLFTEHYMVQFLLENSLGAWWAARHPESPLVKEFTYLRLRDDGIPAAGTFPGWPSTAAEVTVMDPCCGSAHFLSAAFQLLRRMRMEEEGLSEAEAADAVLRDNIFGLELDPRCLQIGAFALALAAWKTGRYRSLPIPNLACSGIPVTGQLEEWTKLAGDDVRLQNALDRLHSLFRDAPELGSLIDPAYTPPRDRMFAPDFSVIVPLLERALGNERAVFNDPTASAFGMAAKGVARAAELLGRRYTMVATNVPFLARGKQSEALKQFIDEHHSESKSDLATVFLQRCLAFTENGGTVAAVTPQNWLFLTSYGRIREILLKQETWNLVVRLGVNAFETISGHVVNVCLVILSSGRPTESEPSESDSKRWDNDFTAIDVSRAKLPLEKATYLKNQPLRTLSQAAQLGNAGSVLILDAVGIGRPLKQFATALSGSNAGDSSRFIRQFWELPVVSEDWEFHQSTVSLTCDYGGRSEVIFWEGERGSMYRLAMSVRHLNHAAQNWLRGKPNWGKNGVIVSQIGNLYATIYTGEIYDLNCVAVVPNDPELLPPLWAFLSSKDYANEVRKIDQALKVTPSSLLEVPFDVDYWVSQVRDGGALPPPYSNDPTQWLFEGNPAETTETLQVGVARLLGYEWPQQEADSLSSLAVEDGMLPLIPLLGTAPAAERLRLLLAMAFGDDWSQARFDQLLDAGRFQGKNLDAWLRDGFFEQHCKLFHQRPFIWQIWDGLRDGFSALVNYHQLDAARLDKLTYTYLGEWIRMQTQARDEGTPGADARLVAALELKRKLEAIREGEPPYDIYVRWKPLHQQPIGWEPDLNDGVRMNIRPFVQAGVLRIRVNVKWGKDRGLNTDGSERLNDLHFTRVEKRRARENQAIPDTGGES
jgi:hypothetical protein